MTTRTEAIQVARDAVLGGVAKRFYSGRAHKCCCGCSGKYSDPSARWINKMAKAIDEAEDAAVDVGNGYVAVETPTRVLIAYWGELTHGARQRRNRQQRSGTMGEVGLRGFDSVGRVDGAA
jgi:hypothetical protein